MEVSIPTKFYFYGHYILDSKHPKMLKKLVFFGHVFLESAA
jgi:hypothetical protein